MFLKVKCTLPCHISLAVPLVRRCIYLRWIWATVRPPAAPLPSPLTLHQGEAPTFLATKLNTQLFPLIHLLPTCAPVCLKFCSCAQRTRRRRSTILVSVAMSHRSLSVSRRASSPFPLWLRASTSASSWTHSYGAYERKTPASPWLVRLIQSFLWIA